MSCYTNVKIFYDFLLDRHIKYGKKKEDKDNQTE